MYKRKFIIECIIISVALFLFGCTSGDKQVKMKDAEIMPHAFRYVADPSSLFQTVDAPELISEDLNHESVIGYVYIQFNDRKWRIDGMNPGDVITLHLPYELILEAEISRKRVHEETASITADVRAPHRGFVSLTKENNRTVGTIDIYSEKQTFHIRYDRRNDMTYLAEVDPSKLDIQPGSPPLVPPNDLHDSTDYIN
jgi:hypothetical protein